MSTIAVSAVIVLNEAGLMLAVRKHNTDMFMNPGGKPEPGEDPAQTAARELGEELGLACDVDELEWVGQWQVPAANEPGHDVDATVFQLRRRIDSELFPQAEIAELRWIDPDQPGAAGRLAPLLLGPVLGHLRCAGL